jgi:hypothetical protein
MCVQRFDDSRFPAIHITFRALLRSSSMQEPRDPLLKVFFISQIQTSRRTRFLGQKADSQTRIHGHVIDVSILIPPQVHLRRPCYDFYFL